MGKRKYPDSYYQDLIRLCPKCGESILYSRIGDKIKAIDSNASCKKCMVNKGQFIKGQPSRNPEGGKYTGKIRGDKLRGKGEGKSYIKYMGEHLHRIVAEEKLGRKLTSQDIVHHIDGNKRNNNPCNIEVTTRSLHAKNHSTKNRKCSVIGCELKHRSKGYCERHYSQIKRLGRIIN